jgi:hypothetical protein
MQKKEQNFTQTQLCCFYKDFMAMHRCFIIFFLVLCCSRSLGSAIILYIVPYNMSRRFSMEGLRDHAKRIIGVFTPAYDKKKVYRLYKACSERFQDFLAVLAPDAFRASKGCRALEIAANYVCSHGLPVDREVLQDLELAIRYRRRMMDSFFDGGDENTSESDVDTTAGVKVS